MYTTTRSYLSESFKTCQDCWANLPLNYYGPNKRNKDGYSKTCKACRSEYNSFDWTKKYGRKYKQFEPDCIRSVQLQNELLLQTYLGSSTSCVGYCPHNDQIFKVVFGVGKYSSHSVSITSVDGKFFQSYEYEGLSKDLAISQIKSILRNMKIRLEKSEADAMVSKSYIYLGTLNVGDPISDGNPTS